MLVCKQEHLLVSAAVPIRNETVRIPFRLHSKQSSYLFRSITVWGSEPAGQQSVGIYLRFRRYNVLDTKPFAVRPYPFFNACAYYVNVRIGLLVTFQRLGGVGTRYGCGFCGKPFALSALRSIPIRTFRN